MTAIAKDVALVEFDRFIEEMDIDADTSTMDAEDTTQFNKQKNRIIRAIENGHLVINEDGEAIYTPHHRNSKHKEPITFHERTGASLMAMDSQKQSKMVARTYAVMADMCKVPASTFAGLAGSDIKVCEALFALLMD